MKSNVNAVTTQLVGRKRAIHIHHNGQKTTVTSASSSYRCKTCTGTVLRAIVASIVIAMTIAVLVMIILTYISSKNVAKSSWCTLPSGQEALVMQGVGNPLQRASARIDTHGNELYIRWSVLKQTGNISDITTLWIKGPLTSTNPVTTTEGVALCGPPTTLVCEGVDPAQFSGERKTLDPGSLSLEPFITAIRNNPESYYVYMTGPNAELRASLGTGCAAGT